MEIRIYNNDFNLISIIENQISLLWNRKYSECGEFTLTVPITPENVKALKLGNLVWVRGKADTGMIETLTFDSDSNTLQADGRFLLGVMDNRLIYPAFSFTGKTEVCMRTLFSQMIDEPWIELGELQGFEEEIELYALYKNLLTYEQNLAKGAALGMRFRPLFGQKKVVFEIYKGLDHSINQRERQRVIFSEEYENLESATYTESVKLEKNICVVGGQGESEYKVYVTVGDTGQTGLNRREVYQEATDVGSEGLTWQQYLKALEERGQMILDQSQKSDSFSFITTANGNFKYGIDYDLGDVVTIKKESWGLQEDMRISEVNEIYESEVPKVEITFGTPIPETITWEV